MSSKIMRFVADNIDNGEKVALVTLFEKGTGAPGSVGQIMAVLKDGKTLGTVGGGTCEYIVIQKCKEALLTDQKVFEFNVDLAEKGMICGGKVKIHVNILGISKKLIIFGGGHVAQSLYPIATSIGFQVTVVEDRPEFRECFNGARFICCTSDEAISNIVFDIDTYVVIATRGHSFDFESLKTCIGKNVAYIGMIGSKQKVSTIMSKMLDEGFLKSDIDKVYAPIGLDISDGTPKEIAISIISEIMQVKNNGTLSNMKMK